MTIRAELDNMRERIENVSEMSYPSEIFEVIDNIAPRLLDAVEKVLELHAPMDVDGTTHCYECDWDTNGNELYPCNTVKDISTALEGK